MSVSQVPGCRGKACLFAQGFCVEPRRQTWGIQFLRRAFRSISDEISIERSGTNLILDCEIFRDPDLPPIVLQPGQPLSSPPRGVTE